jgi:PAS domain S-box-containing protein
MKELREKFLKITATVIALLTIGVGVLAIAGWFLDIGALKSIFPGMVTMKFNTAVAFLLTGVSLLILQVRGSDGIFALLARVCSVAAGLLGLLTLIEYAAGTNSGIDQFFFKEPAGAVFTTHLGRMAAATAINFFLLNSALLLIGSRKERNIYVAQIAASFAGLLAYQALVGYILGVKLMLILNTGFTAMALHTAVLFLLLAGGVIFASGDTGLMRLVSSDLSAGKMFRLLFPMALILPPVFGWFKIAGEHAGIISNEVGVSLVALSNAIVFSILLWTSARSIFFEELKRRKAEEVVLKSANEWSATFDSIGDFIFVLDKDSNITKANKAFLDAIKAKPSDVINKRCYEILHKSDRPWPECPHQSTLLDQKSHTEEVDDPKIGTPLLVTTSPVFDEEGNFTGSVHIAKDISQIRRSEQEIKKKVRDLEAFHKFAVGRELKMMELKKRVKELEGGAK